MLSKTWAANSSQTKLELTSTHTRISIYEYVCI